MAKAVWPSERQTLLVMPIFGGGIAVRVRGKDADVEAEEEGEAKETWLCWLWLWRCFPKLFAGYPLL